VQKNVTSPLQLTETFIDFVIDMLLTQSAQWCIEMAAVLFLMYAPTIHRRELSDACEVKQEKKRRK
jgi:hypothetical protein